MMDDLISRQAAIDEIRTMQTYKLFAGDDMLLVDQAEAMTNLMMMPAADFNGYTERLWKEAYERGKAEAHQKGKWVYDEERGARGIYAICTACNEMIYQTGGFNYCPNCGARMEVEE